jgi:DNA-binding MarR family transcriptional regulator
MPRHDAIPTRPVGDRFGYLLKHARERLSALSAEGYARFGINGRELAVLTVLADGEPPSQLEAAQRLSIDRTTMVALLDELEAKGLVARSADPADRRRNIVVLTPAGRECLVGASRATDEAERAFLAPLGETDRQRLREMLRTIVLADDPSVAKTIPELRSTGSRNAGKTAAR